MKALFIRKEKLNLGNKANRCGKRPNDLRSPLTNLKLMKLLSTIPAWLKSKYLIAGTAFVIWMLFFDRNDVSLQLKRINELNKLQQSEENMNRQIANTKKELELLKTNPSTLEKYAREKYMMKKDNEDLYIIDTTYKNSNKK